MMFRALATCGILLAGARVATGYPTSMLDSDLVAKHDKAGEVGALQRRFRPGPPEFPLHIMALGDFITVGAQAAPGDPGDAYRRNLRDYMRSIGWEVDMVGSKRSGSMKDKDHEAVEDDAIEGGRNRIEQALETWTPNVVLIELGTVDARNGKQEGASERMEDLINTITSKSPDTVMILSTLLPGENQETIDAINQGYRDLVQKLTVPGPRVAEWVDHKLLLADMVPSITLEDLHDGISPSMEGYKKMAAAFADTIKSADEKGMIVKPADNPRTDGSSTVCRQGGDAEGADDSCDHVGDDTQGANVPDPGLPTYIAPGSSGEMESGEFFCDKSAGAWDPAMWEDHKMSNWVTDWSNFYNDKGWPETPARTFAEYNENGQDNLWNWPPDCMDIAKTCSLDETALTKPAECKKQWQRPFTLWAASNVAKSLQAMYNVINDAISTTALDAAGVVVDFQVENPPEPPSIGPMGTFILGITGAMSIFTGPMGPFFGGVTNAIVMLNGLEGIMKGKEAQEPLFTQFSQLSGVLGKLKEYSQDMLKTYFERLLASKPPVDDMDPGTDLAKLLQDSSWADQDLVSKGRDSAAIVKVLRSAIITELWNAQKMVVVKFKDETFRDVPTLTKTVSWSPCFGAGDGGLDEFSFCMDDGFNYAIVSYHANPIQSIFLKQGFDKETLEKYGFNQKDVLQGAIRRQESVGKYVDRGTQYFKDVLQQVIDTPIDTEPANLIAQFNMPICDLTTVTEAAALTYSNCGSTQNCINRLIPQMCAKASLNGTPFIYPEIDFV